MTKSALNRDGEGRITRPFQTRQKQLGLDTFPPSLGVRFGFSVTEMMISPPNVTLPLITSNVYAWTVAER